MSQFSNPNAVWPNPSNIVGSTTEYSGYVETRLMKSYTRSDRFDYKENGNQDPGAMLLKATEPNSYAQQVGYPDSDDPTQDVGVCVKRELRIEGPNSFRWVSNFEKSTGKTVWEELGNVTVEMWNFDKDGKLCDVKYTPKSGANPGGFNWIPHVPNLPRFVQARLLRRTRIITTTVPILGKKGMSLKEPAADCDAFINIYTGKVNETEWFNYLPRQVVCTRINYQGQNGFTYTETADFLYRERTWDELALYLTDQNKRLSDTDVIPPPSEFANSPETAGNGWGRYKMNEEVDFNDDFDPTSDTM